MHTDTLRSGPPVLSVVVLTYNEEANIVDCLQSLEGLLCDIFVVDSGSDDRTCRLAAEYGAKVFQHPFENYSAQRNWAQAALPLSTEWILHLDADERLSPQLAAEINRVLAEPPAQVAGFLLRKRTVFMGRWIKHGGHYPSYHLRLFRKEQGCCEQRLYDQHFIVKGEVRQLQHDYIDILTSNVSAWSQRHIRWAELEAREIGCHNATGARVQPRFMGTAIERRRWLRESLYLRAPKFLRCYSYWFYRYFLRLGFLDGTEGLIFHFLQGLWFRVLIDAKLTELARLRQGPAAQAVRVLDDHAGAESR